MGHFSQVGLALTTAAHDTLQAALRQIADNTLRHEATRLLLMDATRFDSLQQGQVLYFWDWTKWSADRDPGIAWLEAYLDALDSATYVYVRLGEHLGDYDRTGALEDVFGVGRRHALDFVPNPDQPYARPAMCALLTAARSLVTAYAKSEQSQSIDWEDLDAAHRLALEALRVFG